DPELDPAALPVAGHRAARGAVHGLAAHPPAVRVEADAELDAIGLDAAPHGQRLAVPGRERAGQRLEILLEADLARRQAPRAGDFRRHVVEVGGAPGDAGAADVAGLDFLPARDLVAVVDDRRAGGKRQKLVAQLF